MRSLTFVLVFLAASITLAADWQQFRGGTSGRVETIHHPLTWDASTNIAWTADMQGSGWSSPVIAGDRVFLTAAIPADGSRPKGMMAGVSSMRSYRSTKPVLHTFVVRCLSLKDGSEQWSRIVAKRVPPVMHPSNTYATESPVTDGEKLFTFFANTGTLTAWSLAGDETWKKDLGTYKSGNGFGSASSLALHDGIVFVQNDNDERSFVAAFDGSTGDQVWRDDRTSRTSWSSPLIWNANGQSQLITCGSGFVKAYEPATGKVLWKVNGVESAFSASPTVADQQIFFGNSGPMSAGPLVAVGAGLSGEVQLSENFESEKVAWSRTKSGPGMASPVVSNGRLYIPGSGGILNCYDVTSGERMFRTRVPKMATVVASLWADSEHVFILDENGNTHVISSGPTFELVRTNSLDGLFWSTPTIAGDALLLRGVERLYCIRK